jgi:hypothetical protein
MKNPLDTIKNYDENNQIDFMLRMKMFTVGDIIKYLKKVYLRIDKASEERFHL